MIQATCHCGAVRFAIAAAPAWVLDCNCTLCRRYGALWCYTMGQDPVTVVARPDPEASETYAWLDQEIGFRHCRTCGCVTHFDAIDRDPPEMFGLNARMMVGLDGSAIPVRRIDNGHLGWFWTRDDGPVIPGRHPNAPPPGREWEWR
jgi:hypothetical protein